MTPLKTYRVSFIWQGKHMWDYIAAPAGARHLVQMIVQQRYPGSTSFFITEES